MSEPIRLAGLQAERFDSLDEQDRALKALRPGVPWLEWAPTRGKCVIRDIEPWVVQAETGAGKPHSAAAAIVRRGARFSGVDFVWAGADAAPAELVAELPAFARARSAPRIVLETLGATCPLPAVPGETQRLQSAVYCIDLADPTEPEKRLGKNHRRNVKRARKEGIAPIEQDAASSVAAHARLCQSSFERRSVRGEKIESDAQAETFAKFVASGYGRIHQVGRDAEVLSSDLVVRVADSAYYLSGGTSPEGMKIGSSHLLMLGIMEELRAQGVRTLNLGYTDTEALARFKSGFGAECIAVERVFADTGSLAARQARRALRWARRLGRRS